MVVSLRKNIWDEENRLMAVDLKPDERTGHPIAAYTYDAAGERTVRYNLDHLDISSNATEVGQKAKDNVMVYPSGLLMGKAVHAKGKSEERVDRFIYTKHYYIGAERVGAKTGTLVEMGLYPEQLLSQEMPDLPSITRTLSNQTVTSAGNTIISIYNKFALTPPAMDPMVEPIQYADNHGPDTPDSYYFHPDHLGSSSYITNSAGSVSQHMEYLPFGETLVDEHVNSRNSPFKFNGKELDEETGNYYYGARYYDPKWSIFISVDPLAEIQPNKTPYHYCSNNPIMRTDPTGMLDVDWFDQKAEKQAQKIEKTIDNKIAELNKGNASDKNDRITELQKSKSDISDMRNDKNNQYKFDKSSNNGNAPEAKRTGANEITIFTDNVAQQIHENRHGGQIARGEYDIDIRGNLTKGTFGVSKEFDAYKAQYSFEGKIEYIPYIDFNNPTNLMNFATKGINSFKQTITSMGQINNTFIQNLVDNPGLNQTFIYPDPAVNPTYYKN